MEFHDEQRNKRRQSWNSMMNRGTSVANHGEFHDEQRNKRCQSWNFMMNKGTSVDNHGISCSTEEKASTVVEIETVFVCGFLTMLVRWILTYSIRNTVHIDFFCIVKRYFLWFVIQSDYILSLHFFRQLLVKRNSSKIYYVLSAYMGIIQINFTVKDF